MKKSLFKARTLNSNKAENPKALEYLKNDLLVFALGFQSEDTRPDFIPELVYHLDTISPRASSLGSALSYVLLLLPESIRDPLLETDAGTVDLQALLLGTELTHCRS